MNSKKMKMIVAASYKNDQLDQEKVNKIISVISKTDLKKYINILKSNEKKKSLIVSTADSNNYINTFEKIFPHKKIIFKKNSDLILGIEIVDNDIVYEFTLRNSLNKILNYIEQNYD